MYMYCDVFGMIYHWDQPVPFLLQSESYIWLSRMNCVQKYVHVTLIATDIDL